MTVSARFASDVNERSTSISKRFLAAAGIAAALSACGGGSNDAASAFVFPPSPPATTQPPAQVAPVALGCDDSIKTSFKPDSDTTVLLVKQFKKGDPIALSETPASPPPPTADNDLCLVKLLVGPGNSGPATAPSTSAGIGIEVWLPSPELWNKRIHAIGQGGFVGGQYRKLTVIGSTAVTSRPPWEVAGNEGAVSSQGDTGHVDSNGSFAMNPDGTINQVLWKDFSERGIHEQAVKTKALAAAYYGVPAKYSYWDGFSTGGRQGYKFAQTYPNDFDGILAGAPAINWTKLATAAIYPQVVYQRDLAGVRLSKAQRDLVSQRALDACDVVGGTHLGFLIDSSACRYDPTTDTGLLCAASGGTNATASCFSTTQAAVVNKIWYGFTGDGSAPSPSVDNGWSPTLAPAQRWYGLSRGTSLEVLAGDFPFTIATAQIALELQDAAYGDPGFFANGSKLSASAWKGMSYGQLSDAFNQGITLQSYFGEINTDDADLSALRDSGHKLLGYHGTNDVLLPVGGTINYRERVTARMGGNAAADKFYKLYLVTGMGHAQGTKFSDGYRINPGVYRPGIHPLDPTNPGDPNASPPAPTLDQLYAMLTDWVEKGVTPPDRLDVTNPPTATTRTSLPLCAYPRKVTYVSGDPKLAVSYSCS